MRQSGSEEKKRPRLREKLRKQRYRHLQTLRIEASDTVVLYTFIWMIKTQQRGLESNAVAGAAAAAHLQPSLLWIQEENFILSACKRATDCCFKNRENEWNQMYTVVEH